MPQAIHISPIDNVVVALHPIAKGTLVEVDGLSVTALEDIPQGHKMAVKPIKNGENVIKYGFPIGHATADAAPGSWMHTHNVHTNLSGEVEYTYNPAPDLAPLPKVEPETFMGFRRKDGRAAIRNEIWIIPTLPLDKKDLEEFASALEDRFNNPFVNHELMSISLNSTSKWKARNMPSFLAYIEEQKQLPKCLTMSLAAYIAFYSNDIQERTADGLICKRPAGNTYKIQDDAWALDFYYAHKDDTAAQLVHAVLTNTQMWDQDLTKIEGLEAAVLADLEMIRAQGAEAAYKSCL